MQLSEIRQRLIDFYGNTFSEDTEFYNRVINDVYQEVCSLADWYWLKKRESKRLEGIVKDVTVTLTDGSTAVTLSSAPSTVYRYGWLAVPSTADEKGRERVYRLVELSGDAGTLDQKFIGTSGSYEVTIWNDWIYLTGDVRILSCWAVRSVDLKQELSEVSLDWWTERPANVHDYARRAPLRYAVTVDRDRHSGATTWIRFWPPLNEVVEVEYEYRLEPTDLSQDSDEPYIPKRYHGVLVAGGIMRLAKIAREDPDVVAQWQAEYDRHLRHLWRDQLASVTEPRRFGRRKRRDIRVKIVHPTASAGDWP